MRQKITTKDIVDTMLEVQSHSGLPISVFIPAASFMMTARDFELEIDLPDLINLCMIDTHKFRRKGINKNLKSYDW